VKKVFVLSTGRSHRSVTVLLKIKFRN